MRVALVSCGKRKAAAASPARALYSSRLFDLHAQWAERFCDRWYILSAKYGLVAPDRVLEPYDETLKAMRPGQVRTWGVWVASQVRAAVPATDTLVMLAGQDYAGFLAHLAHRVERPLDAIPDRRFGYRMQWLKQQLEGVTP